MSEFGSGVGSGVGFPFVDLIPWRVRLRWPLAVATVLT